MLTHAHMQTHVDTWTHTTTQVIDANIDALTLNFFTNHTLIAEYMNGHTSVIKCSVLMQKF